MAYSWPTTKGTTEHLDQSTDDPNEARPQIKQNIENVNKIIDNFATTTPSNGDTWVFNSATDKFEPSATGTGQEATIQLAGTILSGKAVFTTVRDDNSILTEQTDTGYVSGTNVQVTNGQVSFQLPTGTYRISCGDRINAWDLGPAPSWQFKKVNTSAVVTTIFGTNDNHNLTLSGGQVLFQNFDQREFTVTDATDKYYFFADPSNSFWVYTSGSTLDTAYLEEVAVRITKIA